MDRARRRTSTLERELDHLRDRRRAAEAAAVRALDRAHDLGIKNDPWYKRAWGAVDRWVDDHAGLLRGISTGLKWVSAAAGLLSFIPVLAPICGPIALAAGGAALLMDAALAASGNASWKMLAVDGVLIALPGAGRLVRRGVRSVRGTGSVRTINRTTPSAGRLASTGIRSPACLSTACREAPSAWFAISRPRARPGSVPAPGSTTSERARSS